MDYLKDSKTQIYANVAYRLGKIVLQYDELNIPKKEKYEATLYLAVLQSLLTRCKEHLNEMADIDLKVSPFKMEIDQAGWGLDKSCWVQNTFREALNLKNFIARIRNSVSHPTEIDIQGTFPSTGFTTFKNNNEDIAAFCFVNSPDIETNELITYNSEVSISGFINRNKKTLPLDISYDFEYVRDKRKYFMVYNSEKFARISKIVLTVDQMRLFTINLSNYLAQPKDGNWNGDILLNIIAA